MSEENLTTIVVAVLGVLGAAAQVVRARRDPRDHVEQDLRILSALPEASSVRPSLLTSIEARISGYTALTEARRDPLGWTIAIIFLLAGGYLVFRGWVGDGWWRLSLIPGVLLVLFGVVGWSQDGIQRVRDERGRAIRN